MISRHRLNERLCACQFAQRDAEVICIVEGVHQVSVEGVDVCEFGEGIECRLEFLDELLGGELYFACVEGADTTDLEAASSVQSVLVLASQGWRR